MVGLMRKSTKEHRGTAQRRSRRVVWSSRTLTASASRPAVGIGAIEPHSGCRHVAGFTGVSHERTAAGTDEPAGAALLDWLADVAAR